MSSTLWTFAGAHFQWLRTEVNGAIVIPRWKRQPVLNKHQLAGSDQSVITRLGIGPYTISGPIWLPANSDITILEDRNGTLDTVDDGEGNSWSAVLEFDLNALSPGDNGGYTGSITLTRPTP